MGPGTRGYWLSAGRSALCALMACALLAFMHASAARADSTVTVTTTTDETTTGERHLLAARGDSLRRAAPRRPTAGPAPSGTTTIILPSGHYLLSGGTLSLTRATRSFGGAAAGTTIIDGGGASQVLNVGASSQSSIGGVTVTGGASGLIPCGSPPCFFAGEDGAPGGGISNAGTLTLVSSVVSGNTASAGDPTSSSVWSTARCPGESPFQVAPVAGSTTPAR